MSKGNKLVFDNVKLKGEDEPYHNGAEVIPQERTWLEFIVTDEPPDVPAIVSIHNIPVCTVGNHSHIIGKKKSRKTLFITWLISNYSGDFSKVLICDTEQGRKHVWKIRDRIYRLTGHYITILSLRGLSPQDRCNTIQQAIEDGGFELVVVDGIRDLLSNINDPDQCTQLVTWVESMTVTHNLHMINVLHMNKTDTNARGHLGTELLNKAECTIELELDEKAECTIVKCESSRDIPFESFAFTHNVDGLPEIVSMPIKGQTMTDAERKERLQYVFEDELLKYHDLVDGIKTHFAVGKSKAENLVAEFLRLSWIVKNGRDRSPDAVYKLMVGALKGGKTVTL
jgi:hypothetical protein